MHASARDRPTKRNLDHEFTPSAYSRTGGERKAEHEVNNPMKYQYTQGKPWERDLGHELEKKHENELQEKLHQKQARMGQAKERGNDYKGKEILAGPS